MIIKRKIAAAIQSSKKSILLLGPRQTGKSTLLLDLKPDRVLNLAKESEFLRYSSNPEFFEEAITDTTAKTIFVDEIQRIPSLLNSIQAVIDENRNKRPLKFLLSGSSARKLRRGHANLLPGRILTYELGGLCGAELDYKIDLKRALSYGFLPEPYFERDISSVEKLLESYAGTYLKEEIQAESISRNIQGYARFLQMISENSGQILDVSKIATKAKISRTTAVRFVELLEDTLIAERVSSFQGAGNADVIAHSKLYFFDVGVLNGMLNNFNPSSDRKGTLFEHFIFNLIRNSGKAHDLPIGIYFFRTRNGVEVDFIVKIKGKVFAIEAKSSEVSRSDISGLKAFKEYYPNAHRYIAVSPDHHRRVKDGIMICGWMDLLKELGL